MTVLPSRLARRFCIYEDGLLSMSSDGRRWKARDYDMNSTAHYAMLGKVGTGLLNPSTAASSLSGTRLIIDFLRNGNPIEAHGKVPTQMQKVLHVLRTRAKGHARSRETHNKRSTVGDERSRRSAA